MADRIGELMRGQHELIANVSHELRTPLARLRVLLDTAAESNVFAEPQMRSDIERYLAGRPVQAPVPVAVPPTPPVEPPVADTSTAMRPPVPPREDYDYDDRDRGGPRVAVAPVTDAGSRK